MPDEKPLQAPSGQPLSGPVFVAAGEDCMRCFSRDGLTWTNLILGKDGQIFSAVAFGNGRCVASAHFGGSDVTVSTEDGFTWQGTSYDAKYANYIETLTFFNNQFQALGVKFFMSSDDGLKWGPMGKLPEKKALFGIDPTFHRFCVGNGTVVGIGDFGNAIVTTNGRDWTFAPKTKPADALIDVTYGNGVFVAGGMHGLRMRSVDGLTWTDRAAGEEGEHINFINFDGKQFVGVGQGATYLSPDGLKWTRVPNTNAPTIAAYGEGIYVGSLWPGKMLRSTDGIAWKEVTQLPQSVSCLAFGKLGK